MRWGDGVVGGWGALLLVVFALFGATPVFAQAPAAQGAEAELNARVHVVAKQLRCPVCQGLSLADSQSELSTQMREVIKTQMVEGKTDQQILDYFVAKYGEWILLEPKPSGFNLIAYLLPLFMLAFGVGVIYMSVKKWTRPIEAHS